MSEKTPEPKSIKAISTVAFYQKRYACSCENNDEKATRLFREYESREKLVRLRNEISWIKEGWVADSVCDETVGMTRKAKYGDYENWAKLMLQLLARKA